jgi:serine/threonine-protein kinase
MRWNPFKKPSIDRREEPVDSATFVSTIIEDLPRSAFDDFQHTLPSGISVPVPLSQAESVGIVGRYLLKSELGRGGLGTVYAAWDPFLSRAVAVKTLHRHLHRNAAMVDADEMLMNEARAAARLSHPHIVTIYDAGHSDLGVFIAMEPLRGQDMRKLLKEGWRPSFLEIAIIMRRVADALAFAHGKGVIHCDIKPANIFLVDQRHPKVLDFGIARMAQRDGAAVGVAEAGSPHYLAPEQLRGTLTDRRCDVYSLGVVMYELLTGVPPYGGNSLEEIGEAVLRAPQPVARRVNREVPPGLSAIVVQAMAREPDGRYPSARHLSIALRNWLLSREARESGKALPATVHKVVRSAILIVFIVCAVGLAAWWQTQPRPASLPTPAAKAAPH